MNPLTRLVTKLGTTSGALAKTTLLAAAVMGGTLLAGGEAKAQVSSISCVIAPVGVAGRCPDRNVEGWIIGDKKLTWDFLPTIDSQLPRGGAADIILFNTDEGRWNVTLDFSPINSQFGGEDNNTDPNNDANQADRAPRLPNGSVAEAAWTYTLEILDPDFVFATASAGAALDVGGEDAYFDVVKDVVWDGNTTRLNLNEGVFNPQIASIGGRSVTTTLDWGSCPECSFASITDSYRQTEVPGPLPVLGAAAAFGYSRRLRNRIRLHRPEARIEA